MSKPKGDAKLRELVGHLGYSSDKEFHNDVFNAKAKSSPNGEYTYTIEHADGNDGEAVISDNDGDRVASVNCQSDRCCTFQGSSGYLWNPTLITSLGCPVFMGGAKKKKTRKARRTKSHSRSKKSM